MSMFANLGSFFGANGTPMNGGSVAGHPAPVVPPAPPAPAPSPAPAPVPPAPSSSPLDTFQALWQPVKDDKGNPVVHTDPLSQPVLQFDPTKIKEAASKLDFASGIPQEVITKVVGTNGDPAAFTAALNAVAQNVVAAMTASQGQLMNQAFATNNNRLTSALPEHIKRVQLTQQPVENPVLEHPAAAPLINALKQAEFAKNPSADPGEVHKRVVDYVTTFASELLANDPSQVKQKQQQAAKEVNWETWANT